MISHLLAIFGSFVAGVWLATVINDRRWRDRLQTTDPEALARLDREEAEAMRAADEADAAEMGSLYGECTECGQYVSYHGAELCSACLSLEEGCEDEDDEIDPLERNYR